MRDAFPWKRVTLFVAIKVGLTLAVANQYGWHRDELYFLASSRHLALGYVDYPPMTPLLAAAVQLFAPGSLVALRALTAVAGAAVLVLTALIARELGATTRGQAWAALSLLISPVFLGANGLFHTTTFDQLTWAAALFLFARLLRGGAQQLWIAIGAVIGVGLETKFTIAGLPVVMFLALLASSRRNLVASPWPWLGAAVALVLFAPNLAWQATHEWISVQYTLSHRGRTEGPAAYWLQQLFVLGLPLIVPGVAGLVALRKDPRFTPLVYVVVGAELLFFATGGKSYYPAPVYPVVYAAGAMWLDDRLRSPLAVGASIAAAAAITVVSLPLLLPVLPARAMVSSGIWKSQPGWGEMIGWQDLVKQTATVYQALPADQRANAIILTGNYGEAGAVDLYGPAYGLPQAVSRHLSFWYWAPPRMDPPTAVVLGFDSGHIATYFDTCRQAGTVTNEYRLANQEYGGPILVCTNPRQPLWKVWASLQALD